MLPCRPEQQARVALLVGFLASQEAHASTTWYAPVSVDALDVDPVRESDALVSNIFQHLADHEDIKDHQGRGNHFEGMPLKSMMIWSTKSERLTSKFSLVYFENEIYAFTSGSGGPGDRVKPWLDALSFALAKQQEGHPVHEWAAAIGIRSHTGGVGALSAREFQVGPLVLHACEFVFQELLPSPTSFQSRLIRYWSPIVVRGKSKGHSWQSALSSAHQDIHLLCNILSVETGVHWTLREAPRPQKLSTDFAWPDKTDLLRGVEPAPGAGAPAPNTLPFGAQRAGHIWLKCQSDERLRIPLAAYFEALSLVEHHPSFALVGFVSVIEEVGKLLIAAEKVPTCEKCKRPTANGPAQRFRKALALVVPPDKVKAVGDRLYKWRSRTAHAGETFYWEQTFGQPRLSDGMMVAPAESMFRARGSSHAQEIARDLLLRLFSATPAE